MRILNVIATMNPADGGPIEWVRLISEYAPQLDHLSEVVTFDDPNSHFLKDLPYKCHALGKQNKDFYHNKLAPWLKDHAKNYDAVLAHGLWRYPSFGTWRALHKLDTPYFIYTHGMLGPWFKKEQPLKHIAKWCYWPWSDYRVLRDARAVFFTCEEEKRLASQSFWLYKANEIVASPGQNIPMEKLESQKTLFYAKYPKLFGKRILLFLGRLVPIKGCDILISAFAKIAQKDPSLCLVFAGCDSMGWQTELHKMAKELSIENQILFTGLLDNNIKWGAIKAAEVGVLPSHHENYSFSTVEFLAASKPVLLTNKVGIHRELHDNNCSLVEEDSEDGILRLLENWLLKSNEEKTEMSNNANMTYRRTFELGSAVKNLFEIIQSNINRESVEHVVSY